MARERERSQCRATFSSRRKKEGRGEDRKKERQGSRKEAGGREGGRKERGRWGEGTTKPKVLLARSSFLLACLLARAPWGGESTVTWHGVTIGMNEDGVPYPTQR